MKLRPLLVAQWIHLRLPSCDHEFDSKAPRLSFFILYLNCDEKRTKINKRIVHILKST